VQLEDNRLVVLEGATNFRDLGGYVTVDGRTVRRGLVYRSDSLQDLTVEDIGRLLGLGLREVLDLRSLHEVDLFGTTPLIEHGVERHHVGFFVEPADPSARAPRPPIPLASDHEAFAAHYLDLLEAAKPSLQLAFSEIVTADAHAVVFHCTAGRDRTGLTAGLLLSALGVDDETIAFDYQLTERYLRFPAARLERMQQVFGTHTVPSADAPPTPAPVMRRTLAGLRERYGSPTGYLADAGVDADVIQVLRSRLLFRDHSTL